MNKGFVKDGIGFSLFSASFGEPWGNISEEKHLFISIKNFEEIKKEILDLYPMVDLEDGSLIEKFDFCGMNWISKKIVLDLVVH